MALRNKTNPPSTPLLRKQLPLPSFGNRPQDMGASLEINEMAPAASSAIGGAKSQEQHAGSSHPLYFEIEGAFSSLIAWESQRLPQLCCRVSKEIVYVPP